MVLIMAIIVPTLTKIVSLIPVPLDLQQFVSEIVLSGFGKKMIIIEAKPISTVYRLNQ